MKNFLIALTHLALVIISSLYFPSEAFGQSRNVSCLGEYGIDFIGRVPPKEFTSGDFDSLSFTIGNFSPGTYKMNITYATTGVSREVLTFDVSETGPVNINITDPAALTRTSWGRVYLVIDGLPNRNGRCNLWSYVVHPEASSCQFTVTQDGFTNPGCFEMNKDNINVRVSNLTVNGQPFNGNVRLFFSDQERVFTIDPGGFISISNGEGENTFAINAGGTYRIELATVRDPNTRICSSTVDLTAKSACTEEEREPVVLDDVPDSPPFELCNVATDGEAKSRCTTCLDEGKLYTAIGCIPLNFTGFTTSIFTLALSLAGGAVLLMILYGAFLILTSSGNPEGTQRGREIITGAIAGLLFIIFAAVILNIIGVEILQIPDF